MVALLSAWRFLDGRWRHVDEFTPRIPFPRKTPDTSEKAIRMPELAFGEYRLEIAGREGDRPIHGGHREGGRDVNTSKCWHSVYRAG
jgi:hypothetical protein